jgi:hypothetical protein
MGKTDQFELRDFLYLDTAKVQSFASVIQGGIATEVSQRIRELGELSGGLKAEFMGVGGNLGTSKGSEHERVQTLRITDPVLFDGLYQTLAKGPMEIIESATLEERGRLEIGQFVRISGVSRPPVLESWIEQLKLMLQLLKQYSELPGSLGASVSNSNANKRSSRQQPTQSPKQMIKQFEAIADLLINFAKIARQDPGKEYIVITPTSKAFSVWCGLLPEFIITPYADFATDVTVVGQVERILEQNNSWKLVDFSKFGNQSSTSALLDALNSLPMGTQPVTEKELEARYPDIFIRPIAVYR